MQRSEEGQGVACGKAPTTGRTIYEVSPGNALISNVSNVSPLPSSLL